MRRQNTMIGFFFAVASLLAGVGSARSQVIATTGFNDVFGIHGDGIANNLPYNIHNAEFGSQQLVEANWPAWINLGDPAAPVVVNSGQFEGDGAAFFAGTAENQVARRNFPGTFSSGSRQLNFMIKFQSMPAGGLGFLQRVIKPTFGGTASEWSLGENGHFWVQDGSTTRDTGIAITPGAYHAIDILLHFGEATWEFSVDGVRYEPATPLRWVSGAQLPTNATYRMEFYNMGNVEDGIFLDAITWSVAVPEPTSVALLGLTAGGVSFRAWRRRAKSKS